MRARLAFLALVGVSTIGAVRCGGDNGVNLDASTDGTSGNDSPSVGDASNDVGMGNDTSTGNDTGTSDASDGGAMDTGSTGITNWGYGTATVSDCSQCVGHTQPCVYCGTADASSLAGNCVQQGTGCYGGAPTGYGICTCAGGNVALCPEAYQVCLAFGQGHYCLTCGEFNQTNGLTCENSGKCDAMDGGCL
jgi:hypothetical protein